MLGKALQTGKLILNILKTSKNFKHTLQNEGNLLSVYSNV